MRMARASAPSAHSAVTSAGVRRNTRTHVCHVVQAPACQSSFASLTTDAQYCLCFFCAVFARYASSRTRLRQSSCDDVIQLFMIADTPLVTSWITFSCVGKIDPETYGAL